MEYQALYRQWRPKTFSQVVGQEAIKATLSRQVATGRIAHAYLFSGTRGTGKTSIARILSRAVNCLDSEDGEPCGLCESCVALNDGSSLDVEEIDAASNNGVDEIRSLRDKIRYPPQSGKYRVYIIDEVHMLSTSAFNALLKTLEDPPPHAVLILATTEPQRLPATILSRCQRFDFKRIPLGEIAGRLREAAQGAGAAYREDAIYAIARAAEGGMRDALSLLDVCIAAGGEITLDTVESATGSAGRAFLFEMGRALAAGDVGDALRLVDRAMRDGRDAAVLARDVGAHLRTMMVLLAVGEADGARVLEVSPEEAHNLHAQAKDMGDERSMRALDLLSRVEPEMRWAAHPRALLELTLARACRPETEADLSALLQRIEALEKQVEKGIPVRETPAEPAAPAPAVRISATSPAPAKGGSGPATREPSAQIHPEPAPPSDSAKLWPDTLAAIRKTHISLYTALRRARMEGIRDGVALIAFAPEDEVFHKMMLIEQNQQVLKAALAQVAGKALAVKISLGGAHLPPPAQDAPKTPGGEPEDDWVKDAIELFGRDKVGILENGGDET